MQLPDQPVPVHAALDDDLRQRVLLPYKENCRYVHRATVARPATMTAIAADSPATWLRLEAECGVPASCYIEDTGHFNAVEFNIVYNQMLYLGIAEAVRHRLWPDLQHKTLDDFFRHQLPDVLIVEYLAHFRRPMQSRRFQGWITFCGLQAKTTRDLVLLQTKAGCTSPEGGLAESDVTVALVNWRKA
jgi:hypothetical protein